ncbi:DNA-dependent ATPase RDH54 KNAG_0J02230 [Huiozyma naganishii CBS 8797]|uniref:DNA repair and recombination protein RDH54 n=1 Tax=Huiozyma naganishii (strain ATCC MYA-139 / BCRC 22969 / CBS 8797 / KCTC 17520 / NBRC 10181 / NCYC 3082 / Yp74L-3) TaxID=1071383 RepID=J7S9U4_HUIN7|nr:hypothetical protein KNAG_0J02230 [Kazachstania naganishii CBS 8797]CCK72304.1 hypothetical protein KNAG_0J02230 [Kazachstania naganishii CBS 8797]
MHLPEYKNQPFKAPRKIASTSIPSTTLKRSMPVVRSLPTKKVRSEVSISPSQKQHTKNVTETICFTTMYRKPSNKKMKTWAGDGYAVSKNEGKKLVFYNDNGQSIGTSVPSHDLKSGEIYNVLFRVSGWEVQLDHELTKEDELVTLKQVLKASLDENPVPSRGNKKKVSRLEDEELRERSSGIPVSELFSKKTVTKFKSVMPKSKVFTPLSNNNNTKSPNKTNAVKYLPVFDLANIPNPIIMNKSEDADVDVIVDPLLGKHMRNHQREGVKFIYDCVMGLLRTKEVPLDVVDRSLILEKDSDINGCLLADDMGLGKTLMTITLIWTLLKQTPYASKVECSQSGVPLQGTCKKVLIVCPVTLIGNWTKEFHKWLGHNRVGLLTLHPNNTPDMDRNAVKNFLRVQRTYQVLIIGYEKLLNLSEELQSKQINMNRIDLLVCDEGHRLKNSSSKVLNVLKELDVKRKVLLSGTPIQNDLTEFYTIIDFINPGILGSFNNFKRKFIVPITRARDVANKFNDDVQEVGEERSKEIIEITNTFILRRTNDILTKYLPPKTEVILFCKPSKVQLDVFYAILNHSKLDFGSLTVNSSLGLITLMKKICNSPSLLKNDPYYCKILKTPEKNIQYLSALDSGKLRVLSAILNQIRTTGSEEKVVIVSNYTQTLDIIQNVLNSNKMVYCRLDGSTAQKERDAIINSFNKNPAVFAFLLSAKSGGVGLNLIGASRLILFDNDWNPSVDLQAMSRIHRDGQKKPCFIYRLVTTGCIDEKVLQRQLMKHSLSQKFLDNSNDTAKRGSNDDLFTKEELKDLFTISSDTLSNTHDLICTCDGNGEDILIEEQEMETADELERKERASLSQWNSALEAQKVINESESHAASNRSRTIRKCLVGYRHINPAKTEDLCDDVTSKAVIQLKGQISFALVKPGSIYDEIST